MGRNKLMYGEEQGILALNGIKTQREVAKQFDVSVRTIRNVCIRRNITWIEQGRNQSGNNNGNYINGQGRSTIERLTRSVVIRSNRDLYICERCGNHNEDQEQHRHHKDRDRTNNDSSNIEVLCVTCHNLEHNTDRIRNATTGRFA